jgi:hypothetical protein
MAFTSFLEAVGVPNRSKETLERLEEISRTLDEVAREVSEINGRVVALARQLNISTLTLTSGAQENLMSPAITNIQTHYTGSPGRMLRSAPVKGKAAAPRAGKVAAPRVPAITNLSDWVRRRVNGEKLPEQTIARFMANITETWNIPVSINQIRNGLIGTGHGEGALQAWTKLYIAQMVPGTLNPDLFRFYELLEQRFLFAAGVQMQGVYLVMLEKTHGSSPNEIPPNAMDFLTDVYAEHTLRPQVDGFLECVEKMVLSQGQWRSPWPIVDDVMKLEGGRKVFQAGMGVPADSGKILLRSEVICRRLMETFRDMRKVPAGDAHRNETQRSSGIYVHKLVPNNWIVDGEGPELAPWTDGGSKGRVLAASGALVPAWSGASGGYAQLSPSESSQLRIARYFWPYSEIRGPVTPDFANGKRFHEHTVGQEELQATGIDWPGLWVYHAHDLTALTAPIEGIDPVKGAWTISPIAFRGGRTSGEFLSDRMDLPVMSIDTSRAHDRAWLKLTGTQIPRNPNVRPGFERRVRFATVRSSCPLFFYDHPVPRSLRVHLWLSMFATRTAGWPGAYMHGRIWVRLKTPKGIVPLFDSNTSNDGVLNLWDRRRTSASLELNLTEVVKVASTGAKELYRLDIVVEVAHLNENPNGRADIECKVKEVSISWAQPAFGGIGL